MDISELPRNEKQLDQINHFTLLPPIESDKIHEKISTERETPILKIGTFVRAHEQLQIPVPSTNEVANAVTDPGYNSLQDQEEQIEKEIEKQFEEYLPNKTLNQKEILNEIDERKTPVDWNDPPRVNSALSKFTYCRTALQQQEHERQTRLAQLLDSTQNMLPTSSRCEIPKPIESMLYFHPAGVKSGADARRRFQQLDLQFGRYIHSKSINRLKK
jgi:hypothetical protein